MAVELHTDLLGKIMIGIADPTLEQTAYGLLADLLFIEASEQVGRWLTIPVDEGRR
jgi:hypothetical protein